MVEQIITYLDHAGVMINLFAVAVIVFGLVLASGRYICLFWKIKPKQNFKKFKVDFGYALLLGLEILILADVIETIIVKPTFPYLGFLALLIVMRTVVSWTLTLEVKGCWPWQEATLTKDGKNNV